MSGYTSTQIMNQESSGPGSGLEGTRPSRSDSAVISPCSQVHWDYSVSIVMKDRPLLQYDLQVIVSKGV